MLIVDNIIKEKLKNIYFIWGNWSSLDNIGKAYFMHISVVSEIIKRIWAVL